MQVNTEVQCTAFAGSRRITSGELRHVVLAAKEVVKKDEWSPVLIFNDLTSDLIEVDFRGTPEEVLNRLGASAETAEANAETASSRRPGRPRLGVVAREVTLLPRHWEWLNRQPGGASVALRKLVEQASRDIEGVDRLRIAKESAYRFMSAMAGNEPGFEEACRALFAGNREAFEQRVEQWPADIRDHTRKLAELVFRGTQKVPS